ncbi:MAG: hypothetical protein IKE01_06500 [Clostridia bacterium]|nr:hypothetical protein [Clostridia bacterium]
MKIYGIYDLKNSEQCVRVGTLGEIINFLSITTRETTRMFKDKLRGRYKVIYLFTE